MTEQEYQVQINHCEQGIQSCYDDIQAKSKQVEELQAMQINLQKVMQALEDAANAGSRKLKNLIAVFAGMGCRIKGRFFENEERLYTGAEYRNSCAGLEESSRRVYQKIEELQEQIRASYAQISQFEQQITDHKNAITALATESGEIV